MWKFSLSLSSVLFVFMLGIFNGNGKERVNVWRCLSCTPNLFHKSLIISRSQKLQDQCDCLNIICLSIFHKLNEIRTKVQGKHILLRPWDEIIIGDVVRNDNLCGHNNNHIVSYLDLILIVRWFQFNYSSISVCLEKNVKEELNHMLTRMEK